MAQLAHAMLLEDIVSMQKNNNLWAEKKVSIYVKLFHFNCIEKDLYIDIRIHLLNLHIGAW